MNTGHGIVAAHTDPRLSLSDLARVHALGRIEPNEFRLDPPGRYRFVTVAPIFVDSGRIAVRCDYSLAGHVYTGPATYGGGPSVTPAVRSVIFFLGPATGSSTPGASAPSTSNP